MSMNQAAKHAWQAFQDRKKCLTTRKKAWQVQHAMDVVDELEAS